MDHAVDRFADDLLLDQRPVDGLAVDQPDPIDVAAQALDALLHDLLLVLVQLVGPDHLLVEGQGDLLDVATSVPSA